MGYQILQFVAFHCKNDQFVLGTIMKFIWSEFCDRLMYHPILIGSNAVGIVNCQLSRPHRIPRKGSQALVTNDDYVYVSVKMTDEEADEYKSIYWAS